jgi:ketosteroid isomerase-like protein
MDASDLESLAESYTEDCYWIHPGGSIAGREGIHEAATEIRKHFPRTPLHGHE